MPTLKIVTKISRNKMCDVLKTLGFVVENKTVVLSHSTDKTTPTKVIFLYHKKLKEPAVISRERFISEHVFSEIRGVLKCNNIISLEKFDKLFL